MKSTTTGKDVGDDYEALTMGVAAKMYIMTMTKMAIMTNATMANIVRMMLTIYIMMKCLSVTKNHHFLLGVSCNHL